MANVDSSSGIEILSDLPLSSPLVSGNSTSLQYMTVLASSALLLTLIVPALSWVSKHVMQRRQHGSHTDAKFPPVPGPKGIPYIGNAPEMDPQFPAGKLVEWAKDFPEIFETTAMGQKLVWVTTTAAQKDLFVNKASNYSSRPPLPSTPGSASEPHYLPLMAYGPAWKRHRSFAVTVMSAAHNAHFYGHLQAEAVWLQKRLLRDPAGFYDTMCLLTARVSSRLAYGSPDSAVEHVYNSCTFIHQISVSGPATMRFPFLAALPETVVPSKREVRIRRERERAHWVSLLDQAQRDYKADEQGPMSYAHLYLDSKHGKRSEFGFESDLEAAYAIGMLCTVAIFTINGLLTTFILAMARHPEWQEQARAEVDEVVGSRQCADPADAPRMPITRAIIKECARWKPTVPLGVPRVAQQDDTYNGYRIAKGTIVHAVEQVISHDPEMYPEPDTFNPARFLTPSSPAYKAPLTQHPSLKGHHGFGAGWRTCPGVGLVEAESFVSATALLAALRFDLPVDAAGREYVPDPKPTCDVIGGPQRFSVSIRPRVDEVGVLRVRAAEAAVE